jgi:hypothetical protein
MDVQKLFLDHFEKLALGIAGAILAAFILTTVVKTPPAELRQKDVEKANKEITAKAKAAEEGAPKPDAPVAAREGPSPRRCRRGSSTRSPWSP